MALPLYQLQISEDEKSDLQVDYVALVDEPAIGKMFLAFNKQESILNFASVNDEERIIVGAAMIPDMPIYRRDDKLGEYNVVFTKETVKCIAEKFYLKNFHQNANIMHDASQQKDGVVFFMSFIRNTAKGMIGLAGDYPEGTWFLGAKVNNDEVWGDVKSGKIKGFSVEGLFAYKKEAMAALDELTDEQKLLLFNLRNILSAELNGTK